MCVAHGHIRDLAIDYVDRQGHITPVEINGTMLRADDGPRILALCRDVTERKKAARALSAAKDRLQAVLDSITDCYIALDYQWRFIEINPAAARMLFHRPAAELIGKVVWEEFPQLVGGDAWRQYHIAVAAGCPVHFETLSDLADGAWFEVHAYPRDGRLEIYNRDITERKKAEEQSAFAEHHPRTACRRTNRPG